MPVLTFNGEQCSVESSTLSLLIAEFGLTGKKVAVELNQEVVPRSEHETTGLKDGDIIEVVQFVGGG